MLTEQANGSSGQTVWKNVGTTLTGHRLEVFGIRRTISVMYMFPFMRTNAAERVKTIDTHISEATM